jgi:hypothetical protein
MTTPEIAKQDEKIERIESDITFDKLLDLLLASGIPVDQWGVGAAKTVGHLLSEITEGESLVYIDASGRLRREVNVLWIDVFHETIEGDLHYLVEDRQEFKDGRIKRRTMDSSLGEKMKPTEDSEEAAVRALAEEIGVTDIASLYYFDTTQKSMIPDTYPGFESDYLMHKYVSTLSEKDFVPEGYVEEQPDKTNYYVWQQIR